MVFSDTNLMRTRAPNVPIALQRAIAAGAVFARNHLPVLAGQAVSRRLVCTAVATAGNG